MNTLSMQGYILAARARDLVSLADLQVRRSQAVAVARLAAGVLRADFGAGRVVLFGSVVGDDSYFHQGSDIDLAAWEVCDRSYFRAVGVLQGLSEFDIDLVLPQDVPSYILSAIANGVEL